MPAAGLCRKLATVNDNEAAPWRQRVRSSATGLAVGCEMLIPARDCGLREKAEKPNTPLAGLRLSTQLACFEGFVCLCARPFCLRGSAARRGGSARRLGSAARLGGSAQRRGLARLVSEAARRCGGSAALRLGSARLCSTARHGTSAARRRSAARRCAGVRSRGAALQLSSARRCGGGSARLCVARRRRVGTAARRRCGSARLGSAARRGTVPQWLGALVHQRRGGSRRRLDPSVRPPGWPKWNGSGRPAGRLAGFQAVNAG